MTQYDKGISFFAHYSRSIQQGFRPLTWEQYNEVVKKILSTKV